MADMAGLEELTLPERLRAHRITLKSGDYDGADLMRAWCSMMDAATAIEQLEARIAEKDAALERRDAALKNARAWVFECWGWLMETDLDMTCPMQTDPLDIVEQIDAILGIEMQIHAALERKPDVASN